MRGGHCAKCIVTADLTKLLKPNDPPDIRLHRLIRELATTDRPRSVITWMRSPAANSLLAQLGERTLKLNHESFDALPPSPAVEHLREMLTHHQMMPSRGDIRLARFATWLDDRLNTFQDRPHIQQPLEQFGRWHHLRRLRADPPPSNMDYATRTAKQEITEAGKFLAWLNEEHSSSIDDLTQEQIDLYWSEGPSTRKHVRAFLQQRKITGHKRAMKAPYRNAESTPMATATERLDAIKAALEAHTVLIDTRIAAVIFLLFGVPIGKIVALKADTIQSNLEGMTISLGSNPAPIPDPIIPLFLDFLGPEHRNRAMNKDSPWLFPSTKPGQHVSATTLWNRLKIFGIQPLATRNATIFDLTKEIDPTSLAALLGYSNKMMSTHAARAGVTMASYPATRIDSFTPKPKL